MNDVFTERLVKTMSEGTTYHIRERVINRGTMTYEKMLETLKEIFKSDGYEDKAKFVADKISGNLKDIEIDKKFLKRYHTTKFSEIVKDIKIYLAQEKIELSKENMEKLEILIQKMGLNKLNEVYLYKYTCYGLPVWNFLKRQLLKNIDETTKRFEIVSDNELCEHFKNADSYKELDNEKCCKVISILVKDAIHTGRFENTLLQWYNTRHNPMSAQHIKKPTLVKLAYGFDMDLNTYDEMCKRVENSYNELCYEDCMMRFAVNYHSKAEYVDFFGEGQRGNNGNEIGGLVNENRKDFRNNEHRIDEESAGKKVQEFFDANPVDSVGDIKVLKEEFLTLLKQIGVSTESIIEERQREKRSETAKKFASDLIDKVDLKKIDKYYKKTANSVDDLILEIQKENDNAFEQNYGYILEENARQISVLANPVLRKNREENRAKILCHLCDNIRLGDAENRNENRIMNTAFKVGIKGRLSKILKGEEVIIRNDILRLGYLDTLIDYINDTDFDDENEMLSAAEKLNDKFEETTNKLLKECGFIPVHITLNHDCLIYLALGSAMNGKCIPEVYQICLPIRARRRADE